jgi:hypothetical protein
MGLTFSGTGFFMQMLDFFAQLNGIFILEEDLFSSEVGKLPGKFFIKLDFGKLLNFQAKERFNSTIRWGKRTKYTRHLVRIENSRKKIQEQNCSAPGANGIVVF